MKRRILVVDDDSSILELMRVLLEGEGYHVQTFDSGAAALDSALSQPPDAAIVDLMMPGMNGLDLVNALRYDPRTQALPILICSAYYGDLQHVTSDLQQENTTCLRKPFQIDELLDDVARMVAASKRAVSKRGRKSRSGATIPLSPSSGRWAPVLAPSAGRGCARVAHQSPDKPNVAPLPARPLPGIAKRDAAEGRRRGTARA